MAIYRSARLMVPGLPSTPSMVLVMSPKDTSLPPYMTLAKLKQRVALGYKATTGGKFADALEIFRATLHVAPFTTLQHTSEQQEVRARHVCVCVCAWTQRLETNGVSIGGAGHYHVSSIHYWLDDRVATQRA